MLNKRFLYHHSKPSTAPTTTPLSVPPQPVSLSKLVLIRQLRPDCSRLAMEREAHQHLQISHDGMGPALSQSTAMQLTEHHKLHHPDASHPACQVLVPGTPQIGQSWIAMVASSQSAMSAAMTAA